MVVGGQFSHVRFYEMIYRTNATNILKITTGAELFAVFHRNYFGDINQPAICRPPDTPIADLRLFVREIPNVRHSFNFSLKIKRKNILN